MISASVPVNTVFVHVDREPGAVVECVRQGQGDGYGVLHLDQCTAFLSDQQLLKLELDIRAYLDARSIDAETAETVALFEQAAYVPAPSIPASPHASDCASWVNEPCDCVLAKVYA